MKTLLVLGYGNIAQAILCKNLHIATHYDEIFIIGRDSKKAQDFIESYLPSAQVLPAHTNNQGQYEIECEGKDILLCTKPKGIESFRFIGKARCVYSVLAGVSVKAIQSHIESTYIVRAMPNIAALSKLSATAFYYAQEGAGADSILHIEVIPFIESFGNAVQVDNEILIESSIAPSGSGIAFLALVAESLIDAGVLEGLTHAQSSALVKQCFAGFSAELAHKSPSEIKYAISSPGGTTIRGIKSLEQSGVRGAFIEAAHIAAQYAKDCSAKNQPEKAIQSQKPQNLKA
ncbi:pyrroline-5-carboxylate reductase [Helicobacter typhlonius]|uniref:pyrroline-5-carboxylate reductase n=1 Tax=Helicobacter typhlonius TaxID=76936 RepID=UPI002FE17F43